MAGRPEVPTRPWSQWHKQPRCGRPPSLNGRRARCSVRVLTRPPSLRSRTGRNSKVHDAASVFEVVVPYERLQPRARSRHRASLNNRSPSTSHPMHSRTMVSSARNATARYLCAAGAEKPDVHGPVKTPSMPLDPMSPDQRLRSMADRGRSLRRLAGASRPRRVSIVGVTCDCPTHRARPRNSSANLRGSRNPRLG